MLAGEHLVREQDDLAREISVFLAERHSEIGALLDREEALGRELRGVRPSWCFATPIST